MNFSGEINLDDVNKSFKRFATVDYLVFIIMLIIYLLIGIYFSCKDQKKTKKSRLPAQRGSYEMNYLMGGKNMRKFPVTMSLVASGISGAAFLGDL